MYRFIGRSITRGEDQGLLRGRGLYVDDVQRPGMLYGAVVRSSVAHAYIRRIDTGRAARAPGVVEVYTAESLGELSAPLPPSVSPLPQYPMTPRTQRPLAVGKVRYVGEPVAFIVAESRYQARDALELVDVEYEPIKPVVDPEEALGPDSPLVHEEHGSNIAAEGGARVGDYEGAAARASVIVGERFVYSRGAGQSIETRGVVAEFDGRAGSLTVWDSTQAPIPLRNGLARILGIPESRVRVVAPNVGGGFGPKVMIFYPEEVLVPYAAMSLGRPVKWIEERTEHCIATNQERKQIHYAEAAFAADGTILGLKDDFIVDTGAYTPYGVMVPVITMNTLPGPYRVRNMSFRFRSVFTDMVAVSPVRGAGRPAAVFVMERLMDLAAKRLGISRVGIRRRNLIEPGEFPWDTGLIYQDGAPNRYDSGNYPLLLTRLLERIGHVDYKRGAGNGRRRGLGIALYVEGSGVGPFEMARVKVEQSGRVSIYTGIGSQGQGQPTTLSQIAAEVLGVPPEQVDVFLGDTAAMDRGVGTFASRSAAVAGAAVYNASLKLREEILELAAEALEARRDDLEIEGGRVHVRGNPSGAIALGELSKMSTPLRGTIRREPGLEATSYFSPERSVYSSGAHAALIEVDEETGEVEVLRWVIIHDCGLVINPMIVEGQIHGGFSNGFGSAWLEEIVYDANGQPLTATLSDYLIPSSMESPVNLEVDHLETRSPLNPLGVKGVGEAGVIPVAAVLASALEDALEGRGVRIVESPLSAYKLWRLVRGRARWLGKAFLPADDPGDA